MKTMTKVMLLCLSLTACQAHGDRAAKIDVRTEIDGFARKAMRQLGTTPGLSVVVVKDERVVYRGDFGQRDVEAKLPVNPDTRFYIASTTKAFTAMVAAILAGEKKLDLDAPLSAVWPELRLTSPLDPARLSLRDLLAMRSGLGNDTINFRMEIGNVKSEAELLRLLAVYSREEPRTFRYSNLSYILAGRVIEKATGKGWADLVAQKILRPLQMTSTTTAPFATGVPIVKCYRPDEPGTFVAIPAEISDFAGPAGGMLMTTTDAAKWLMALINHGRVGKKQILPAQAVEMVQKQETKNEQKYRSIDRFGWGLGQNLGKYDGDLIVHRFGGLNGAYSHVSFMPEQRIGVAAFSNGGGSIPDAVAAFAYDLLLGKKDLDDKWQAELERTAKAVAEQREQRRQAKAATAAARRDAPRPLDRYVGSYHYDRLGDIQVTSSEGRLYGQFGIFHAELISTGGDMFLVDWIDQGRGMPIKFVFDGESATRIDWDGRLFDRLQ